MKELTARQKEVLSFIDHFKQEHNYSPTIREIADHFEISVKGAHDHVNALKRKGSLRLQTRRSRTMEVVGSRGQDHNVEIPLVGIAAAGPLILSEENREGTILIHETALKKNRKYFAFRVEGDSMSGAGIVEGDVAVIEKTNLIHNGEIAAVLVNEIVSLKRFFKEAHRIKLLVENPAQPPVYSQNVRVLGRLSQIIRNY
ncbi:MAG: transcriptional repressor LexA [Treponema sp.]|jgi:repressor LexA|nr:transcriptional repressor LexA [Treponema sp.]